MKLDFTVCTHMSFHPPTAELSQLFPRGCREKNHSVTPPKGRNYQILSGPFQRARDWKPGVLCTWLKPFLFYPYCLSVWSGAIFIKELTFTFQATKWSNIFQKQHTKSLRKIKIEFFFPLRFSVWSQWFLHWKQLSLVLLTCSLSHSLPPSILPRSPIVLCSTEAPAPTHIPCTVNIWVSSHAQLRGSTRAHEAVVNSGLLTQWHAHTHVN